MLLFLNIGALDIYTLSRCILFFEDTQTIFPVCDHGENIIIICFCLSNSFFSLP